MPVTNQPVGYNFLPHYKQDGLRPFTITLKFDSENPVDLTNTIIRLQLRTKGSNKVVWFFTTEGDGDTLLTLNGEFGIIQFPEILSWDIPPGTYQYDLEATDSTGFVRTYLRGEWMVNQDITNKETIAWQG